MDDREENYDLDLLMNNKGDRTGKLQIALPGISDSFIDGGFNTDIELDPSLEPKVDDSFQNISNQITNLNNAVEDLNGWRSGIQFARKVDMTYSWPAIRINERSMVNIPNTIKTEGLIPLFGNSVGIAGPPISGALGGINAPLPFLPNLLDILPRFPSIEIPQTMFPGLVDRPEVKQLIKDFTEGLISEVQLKEALEPYLKGLPPEVIVESEVMRQKFAVSIPLLEIRKNFTTTFDYIVDVSKGITNVDARARWLFGKVTELSEQISGLAFQVGEGLKSSDVRSIISNELALRGLQSPPFSISDVVGLDAKFDGLPTFDDLNQKITDVLKDMTIPSASDIAALVDTSTLGIPSFPVPFGDIGSFITGMPDILDMDFIKSQFPAIPDRNQLFGWVKQDLGITCILNKLTSFTWGAGAPDFANEMSNIIDSALTGLNGSSIVKCIDDKKWMGTISAESLYGCVMAPIRSQLNGMRTRMTTVGNDINSYMNEIKGMFSGIKDCLPS